MHFKSVNNGSPSMPIDQPERDVTIRLAADASGIARAVELLRAGGLVAFPTETVYGLGADARDGAAVARIYRAKGRPSFNPLIVHVPDWETAARYVVFDQVAEDLAQAFWPGALTLVLPLRDGAGIASLVTAGLPTLAVRVPDHPVARALLSDFEGPVAAPSANPSGRISPTQATHVLRGLDGAIDAVVDGGACPVGLESTIVATQPQPTLLRAGGISAETIAGVLDQPLTRDETPADVQAPGQLASHYAPRGAVRLNVTDPAPYEVLLGFGPVDAALNLSATGDVTEAAARLFDCLHQLDAQGARKIAVSPIPQDGLGAAINDRLRRAAAPR